jgi:ABC-2 type transport system ATP-binding protein
MLNVVHVHKKYGQHHAVNDISFQIEPGVIFGLLGPNGAGKSSLLRMVTGITNPDSGSILLHEKPFVLANDAKYIGYMPEERGMYKKMKVREHALYLAQLKGMTKTDAKAEVDKWLNQLDMMSWADKKVEDLSKGMSQKLQFVITVVHKPDLLILDEPFSGLDPVNAEVIKQEIFNMAKNGQAVIFSTHRMEQVEEICDEILLMNKGINIADGKVVDLKELHKDGVFEIKLKSGTLKDCSEFEIKSQKGNLFNLVPNEDFIENQILGSCIKQGAVIESYREVLPTLNEVFIKMVEGNAVTKFTS